MIKQFFSIFIIILASHALTGCSTNPATGEDQFTALMSPQQEIQVGAQEHVNVIKEFGLYNDPALQTYVQQIGNRVTQNTERRDIRYQFFILDTPMVNAFALPGGYIYVTRGLLALANNEAELASVLAHETGHITARHSAERYSRSVLTSLGVSLLSTAIGNTGVSQVIGVGSDLYIKSYSRSQENQADNLGIRYLSRANYDPHAMTSFLNSMQSDAALEARMNGKGTDGVDYFSTHPATSERIASTVAEVQKYPPTGDTGRDTYLQRINGLTHGESAEQGFMRGQTFYHPKIGFQFDLPQNYRAQNLPEQIIAASPNGGIIVFDMVSSKNNAAPFDFLNEWVKDKPSASTEKVTISGMHAATAAFAGSVNNTPMTIRLVAIEWKPGVIARFQMGLPRNLPASEIESLKLMTYSFRPMNEQDKTRIKPHRITLITAKPSDTVESLASTMPLNDYKTERFRVLNGLSPAENILPNQTYKVIVN